MHAIENELILVGFWIFANEYIGRIGKKLLMFTHLISRVADSNWESYSNIENILQR